MDEFDKDEEFWTGGVDVVDVVDNLAVVAVAVSGKTAVDNAIEVEVDVAAALAEDEDEAKVEDSDDDEEANVDWAVEDEVEAEDDVEADVEDDAAADVATASDDDADAASDDDAGATDAGAEVAGGWDEDMMRDPADARDFDWTPPRAAVEPD
ncbi:hypothetical protein HDU82_002362, partial [Entophlyctis luteolus]